MAKGNEAIASGAELEVFKLKAWLCEGHENTTRLLRRCILYRLER